MTGGHEMRRDKSLHEISGSGRNAALLSMRGRGREERKWGARGAVSKAGGGNAIGGT